MVWLFTLILIKKITATYHNVNLSIKESLQDQIQCFNRKMDALWFTMGLKCLNFKYVLKLKGNEE